MEEFRGTFSDKKFAKAKPLQDNFSDFCERFGIVTIF
jgi:hypothetical protein